MRVHYWELSNYNNGNLVGRWFDLDGVSKEDHLGEVNKWLQELTTETGSLCEEFILGDTEDLPACYVGEFGLDSELFDFISLVDDGEEVDMLVAGLSLGIPLNRIQEAYQGQARNDEDFIREHLEETGFLNGVPDHIVGYIDWESVTRDYMINDFSEADGYYFSNNW